MATPPFCLMVALRRRFAPSVLGLRACARRAVARSAASLQEHKGWRAIQHLVILAKAGIHKTDIIMQGFVLSYLPCAEMDDQVEGLGCFMLTRFE